MKNKTSLDTTMNYRDYKMLYNKKIHNNGCYVCKKRVGCYYADCSPSGARAKGCHGSGKYIYTTKYREFKTWKHNRKTQWKN